MRVLSARAKFSGPDVHTLTVRHQNDPMFVFDVRRQEVDGTLAPVTEGPVRLYFKTSARDDINECPFVEGEYEGGSSWTFKPRYDEMASSASWQLDDLTDDRRTTHAYGNVVVEL